MVDQDKRTRSTGWGEGRTARLLTLDSSAHTHLLYAANLGSAGRLKRPTSTAMTVKEVRRHVARAIELDQYHAQAFEIMGKFLMGLPWLLGGDERKTQEHLERAIAADGKFTSDWILLAGLYRKQDRVEDAKKELEAVIHSEYPHYPNICERKFKPEAEQMLKQMAHP